MLIACREPSRSLLERRLRSLEIVLERSFEVRRGIRFEIGQLLPKRNVLAEGNLNISCHCHALEALQHLHAKRAQVCDPFLERFAIRQLDDNLPRCRLERMSLSGLQALRNSAAISLQFGVRALSRVRLRGGCM